MDVYSTPLLDGCTTGILIYPSFSQYILRLVRFLNSGDIRREDDDDEPLFDVHQRKSMTHTPSPCSSICVCNFFYSM